MPPTSMPAPDQPPARGTPPSTPAGPLALSPRDHPPAWWLVADGRIVAGDTGAQGGLVESRLVEAGKWFDAVSGWTMADYITPVCQRQGL